MAPSTTHNQGTPPGSANLSSDFWLESNRTSGSSALMRPSIDRPRSQDVQFPLDAQLSFRSAVRRHRLAFFLLEKIRNFREGNSQGLPSTGVIRHVRRKDYKELERLLGKEPGLERYAFRKLKLTYDAKRSKLFYTMVGAVHEKVKDRAIDSINQQLSRIAEKYPLPMKDGEVQENLAEMIDGSGSTGIFKGVSGEKKEPDGQWEFGGGEFLQPCCVLEVAHSQPYQAVMDVTVDLLTSTRGRPGMAIIIWSQYNNPRAKKTGKLSTFTLLTVGKYKKEDGTLGNRVFNPYSERIIRDEAGNASDEVFSFTIEDMLGIANKPAYDALRNSDDPQVAQVTANILAEKIVLPSATITSWFQKGERREKDDIAQENMRRQENGVEDDEGWVVPPRPLSPEPPSEKSSSSGTNSSDSTYKASSNEGEKPERNTPPQTRSSQKST